MDTTRRKFILNLLVSGGIYKAMGDGFGFWDTDVKPGQEYEYGVFEVHSGETNEQPSVTAKWQYGETAKIEKELVPIRMSAKIKKPKLNKGIKLSVEFPLDKVKESKVAFYRFYYLDEQGVKTHISAPKKSIHDAPTSINHAYEPVSLLAWESSFENPKGITFYVDLLDITWSVMQTIEVKSL